jgi:predicted CXXCH cytochrome family protein
MTKTARRKLTGMAFTLAGVPAAAAVLLLITGLAAQEKSIPDHGSFTDCRMCHAEKYKMWETAGHSRALAGVTSMPGADADCFGCHSLEGFMAKLQGNKVDLAKKESFSAITCIACHRPGSKDNPKQLVRDSEKLCSECHTQRAVLEGKGAKGIEDTRSFHSGVKCVSCHMSEANHDMKLFRPDDPKVPEDRLDTCTRCHKDNNRKMRAKQLPEWLELYKEAMDPIEADMRMISARLKEKPDMLNADLKAKLSDVRSNLFILQRDSSRGAHNLDFALEIISKASKDIKEIKAAIK